MKKTKFIPIILGLTSISLFANNSNLYKNFISNKQYANNLPFCAKNLNDDNNIKTFYNELNSFNYYMSVKNNKIYFYLNTKTTNLKKLSNILKIINKIKNNKDCNIKYKFNNNNKINYLILKGTCKYTEKNLRLVNSLNNNNDTNIDIEKEIEKKEKQINEFIKNMEKEFQRFFNNNF